MIRAARGLANIDQAVLAELVGVDRRTIIRIEADDAPPTNPRRIAVMQSIRDVLEGDAYNVRFVYADRNTGEGVIMKHGA